MTEGLQLQIREFGGTVVFDQQLAPGSDHRPDLRGELFFKWIKQHLRIKKFYGTSENAVKTQIWIAEYSIVRKRLGLETKSYRFSA